MTNIIRKLNRELSSQYFKYKTFWGKYTAYSRHTLYDYRWILMFILARFPLGRTLGTSFYQGRQEKNTYNDTVKGHLENQTASEQLVNKDQADNANISTSIFKDLEVNSAVKSIENDGYCLGLQLPEYLLQEILDYAETGDVSVDREPRLSFKCADKEQAEKKYNQEIIIGNYLAVNSECLAMQKLFNDPKLIAIATEYLGKKPTLVRSEMGWTFVASKQAYAKKGEIGSPTILFHYDLDDYRALKFFFYLTDVDSLSGSHRCVAGSHKKRKLIHYILRSQSDLEIADYYGSDRVIDICGPAGMGFAEDPFCFHRGSPPATSPRLLIQLEFALNDYGVWNM